MPRYRLWLLRAAIRKSRPSVEQLINAAHQEHRINRSWHSPLPRKCVLWRMSPHRAQAVDVRTWLSCGKLGARDHVLIRALRADRGSSHITAEAQAVRFRAGSRSRRRWTISARQWLGWSKHASAVAPDYARECYFSLGAARLSAVRSHIYSGCRANAILTTHAGNHSDRSH